MGSLHQEHQVPSFCKQRPPQSSSDPAAQLLAWILMWILMWNLIRHRAAASPDWMEQEPEGRTLRL
jgi:hypothetical protein